MATSEDLQDYRGKRVLVVGATGYLGSALVAGLQRQNAAVLGWARHRPATADTASLATVDITDPSSVDAAYRNARPDVVFHLGGRTNASRDPAHVLPSFLANSLGTVALLDVAARCGCQRFVYCGSMEEPLDATGDTGATIPSSPYGASKWVGSVYTRLFQARFGLPATIVRPFFVYGPGVQPPDKLVPSVLGALLAGQPARVSSGDRAMDWVYIDDVVEGFMRAGLCAGSVGQSLDLGSGALHTVRDVVGMFAAHFPQAPPPVFAPRQDRLNEVSPRANVAAARAILHWTPATTLAHGVRETAHWYLLNAQQASVRPP